MPNREAETTLDNENTNKCNGLKTCNYVNCRGVICSITWWWKIGRGAQRQKLVPVHTVLENQTYLKINSVYLKGGKNSRSAGLCWICVVTFWREIQLTPTQSKTSEAQECCVKEGPTE